jgi:hypothetical protein
MRRSDYRDSARNPAPASAIARRDDAWPRVTTAGRRPTQQRAGAPSADARHLRELVMVGRLPESWIAPDHILRARVRLRHSLSEQRGEWQQRIQAVFYHHHYGSGLAAGRAV